MAQSTILHRATVEEDKESGEMYITLPPELLRSLQWTEDDRFEWTQVDGDRWKLEKVTPTPKK